MTPSANNALVLVVLAGTAISPLAAETVYRYEDERGTVTYTSDPPPGESEHAVPVEVQSQVPAEQRKAIERRFDKIERAADRLEAEREAEQAAIAAREQTARHELQAARADLREVKRRTPADWQNLANGGRVLKQSYRDRVEAAEQRVKDAQETLERLQNRAP